MGAHPPAFVSFVVITRNSAERIRKCIESIKQVDYPDEMFEIIVVDGGSTDGTPEIARSYGAKVVVFEEQDHKKDRTLGLKRGVLSKSRNIGLANCKGEFVAFVDDDTQVTMGWLKVLLDKGFKHPDVAGATGLHYVPPSDSSIGRYIGVLPIQPPSVDSLDPFPLLRCPFISEKVTKNNAFMLSTKACCYRRVDLLKVGGFDENLFWSEDPDINATLLKDGYQLAFVPEAKDWHQPHQNLRAFAKQQLRAGFGHAHNVQKYPELFQTRWAILLTWMVMAVGLAFFGITSRLAIIAWGFVLLSYLLFLLSYGARAALHYDDLSMSFGVPLVCSIWQLCWVFGFFYGLLFKRYSGDKKGFVQTEINQA